MTHVFIISVKGGPIVSKGSSCRMEGNEQADSTLIWSSTYHGWIGVEGIRTLDRTCRTKLDQSDTMALDWGTRSAAGKHRVHGIKGRGPG